MARRNVIGVFKDCEGLYPKCVGTQTLNTLAQTGDEVLRQNLVPYLNKVSDELEQAQRWRRNFVTLNFTTTPNQAYYPSFITPNSIIYIHKAYWLTSAGQLRLLELMDQQEPRAAFGEGSASTSSDPRYYAILNDQIELFPAPDANGPNGGNYTIYFDCYTRLPKVIQGTCQTLGTQFVNVPSTSYYTAQGVDPANVAGNYLSIRGAGNDSGIAGPNEFDDYTDKWTQLISGQFAVVGSVPTVLAAGTPIFVNSVNWLLDQRPQVYLYGILRQVASYLQSPTDYQTWEARYQKELLDLMDWDNQFRHDNEVMASAVRGQNQPELADINYGNWSSIGAYGWWG